MIHNRFIKAIFIFCLAIVSQLTVAQENLTQYVNPFIGTGGHGHTFPGAVLPFGMVQLSPDTRIDGSWDGCSGYHYSDTLLYGFSHTHLSGTGCSDWGDILLMPVTSDVGTDSKTYATRFSHLNEKASPGYYELFMPKRNIKAELTVTPRVGIHRYTFPKGQNPKVIIDLKHRDKTLGQEIRYTDSCTLVGYRRSEAWAKDQVVYFAIRFSRKFKSSLPETDKTSVEEYRKIRGNLNKADFTFNQGSDAPLVVKVAISGVSEEGALKNLNEEAPHWDFERYKKEAENVWNKQLNKVSVSDTDKDRLTVFYTSLYHCCIHPSLNMDVDGRYRGRDNEVHTAKGFTNYSVFSLWDTYRALHPLFTILEQKRSADFINSFLVQHEQSGRLPMWELSSNETNCMIGFHSVSVIADAMAKGIGGFDSLAAYRAAVAASNYTAWGIPQFNKAGYLQVDDESESVSKSLEYAYDNWCIAQMASMLGKKEDEAIYLRRSQAYRNLFDARSGHMRPRKNGGWLTPFYASEINNHFTEGNSWQYSFYVPHDLKGLINLYGNDARFEKKLDELFETTEKTRGREQADVTGLIGQYAHGNEPSHHMAYLYNFCGNPQKSIQRVRFICKEFYKNSTDGLIGNEDCGQMSAWYVLSSMGFYPVCPGSTQYVLGEPAYSSVTLNLENGRTFTIKASPSLNTAVTGVKLNGVESLNSFISHAAITNGGALEFMNDATKLKNNNYGIASANRPVTQVRNLNYIPAPIIHAGKRLFKDTLTISVEQINVSTRLLDLCSTNGSDPDYLSIYRNPILLDSSCTVKAATMSNEGRSAVTTGRFTKMKYGYTVKIDCNLNPQYTDEGPQTLVDGVYGDTDWRKGKWLGEQGQNFTAVIDMTTARSVKSLALNCIQDTPAWIVFPSQVKFFGSNDNKTFVPLGSVANTFPIKKVESAIKNFEFKLKAPAKFRYVKVVAINAGKLPQWHPGAGGESFIFADELDIK